MPFDTLTAQPARQLLTEAIAPADTVIDAAPTVNRAFYDGDHWQTAEQWAGPVPAADDSDVAAVLAQIKQAFVSKNAIKEVCDRHILACIGSEPDWSITVARELGEGQQPTPAEQALINEANAALVAWWDARGIHRTIQDAGITLLLAARSCLRLYVPKGLTEEGEDGLRRVPIGDLSESLARLYLQHPTPDQAAVAVDEDSQQPLGIYIHRDKQGVETLEVCCADGTMTVLGQQTGSSTELLRWPLDVGGRLLIHQMQAQPLVTEQVRALQRLLNLSLTMLSRNVVQGGFLERVILNGELPGTFVDDATAPGVRRFVPAPFHVGAGSVNFVRGVTTTDSEGRETLANPSAVYKDPVPVDTFTATKKEAYQGILEETHQLHALMSGDAAASGESRIQARADFEASLGDTLAQINAAGRWLLETALALASLFADEPGRFAGLRVHFACRVNTGPLSSLDRDAILKEKEAGLESAEGAMMRLGRADPAATLAAVEAEKDRNAERQRQSFGGALLNFDRGEDG